MKSGSTAIALRAEYGEFCPSAISLSGSIWRKLSLASRIQHPSRSMSGISPMPQLSREGIEKSGTSNPAWRPVKKSRGTHALQDQPDSAGEYVWLWQEADREKGFAGKIEEEPGMDHDPLPSDQVERERLLACGCGHPDDRRPPTVSRKHVNAGVAVRRQLAQCVIVVPHAIADLFLNRDGRLEKRGRGHLHRR